MDRYLAQLQSRDKRTQTVGDQDLPRLGGDVTVLRAQLEEQRERSRTLQQATTQLTALLKAATRQAEEARQTTQDKNASIQTLQDELFTAQLELTQAEQRVSALRAENEALVARWVERINLEAGHA